MAELKTFDTSDFVNYDSSSELCLYEVGTQKCIKSYSFGPCVRARCIFHYVFSGKGTLIINGKTHVITAHQGFLIPANVSAYYQADSIDPWSYEWIHIGGNRITDFFKQAGLSAEQPVFIPTDGINEIENILNELTHHLDREYYCIGKIYELFDLIVRYSSTKITYHISKKLQYIKSIINYIEVKYSEPINVEHIAHCFGFDRSYLTKLFKEATGQTLQEYLLAYRMKQACKMLEQSLHPVQYIAYAVGYGDAFTFSKAFKRYMGSSPTEYQREYRLHPVHPTLTSD